MSDVIPTDWTMQDEAQSKFLPLKYKERQQLRDDWDDKRKRAEANRLLPNGEPNPAYPRMAMEAEMANMRYDMAYVIEQNSRMREQIDILSSLWDRQHQLEIIARHLRQDFDYVKSQYKDSIKRSHEERREWSLRNGMQSIGLDPDSKEDRLKYAKRLDELTAKFFTHNVEGNKDEVETIRG